MNFVEKNAVANQLALHAEFPHIFVIMDMKFLPMPFGVAKLLLLRFAILRSKQMAVDIKRVERRTSN